MRTAIDIGGTKTIVASVDDAGKVVNKERFPTPKVYSQLISKIEATLEKFDVDDTTIVVGAPGRINREDGSVIAFGNLPWTNVPLARDLSAATGKNVHVDNDANLAGLGEYFELESPPHQMLYITISTGIGTGIITDGAIDPDHADSEGGELLINWDGQLVIWESIVSGSAIVKEFHKKASELNDKEAWQDISHRLSIGILGLLSVLEPELIIIGGGVGTHFDKFEKLLGQELAKHKPALIDVPPIAMAKNPENAVIMGCLELSRQIDGKQ